MNNTQLTVGLAIYSMQHSDYAELVKFGERKSFSYLPMSMLLLCQFGFFTLPINNGGHYAFQIENNWIHRGASTKYENTQNDIFHYGY